MPGAATQSDELAKASTDGPDSELAALLRLMTLEHPPSTDVALRAAHAAIDAEPECFRAHDALCAVSGVANLHVATTLAPQVLSEAVPRRIAAIAGPARSRPQSGRSARRGRDDSGPGRRLGRGRRPGRALMGRLGEDRARDPVRLHLPPARLHGELVERADRRVLGRSPAAGGRHTAFGPCSNRTSPVRSARTSAPSWRALIRTDLGLNAMPLIKLVAALEPAAPRHKINGIVLLLADWTVRDLSMSLDSYSKPPIGPDRARKLLAG